jgi:hypothetical protein
MERTRPGIERITYGEVRAERRLAREAERWHKKECKRCGHKDTNVYQRCDIGWELAKRVHAANYAYDKWYDTSSQFQGTLF